MWRDALRVQRRKCAVSGSSAVSGASTHFASVHLSKIDLGLVSYNFEPEYSEEELKDRAAGSGNDGEEVITDEAECHCGRCLFDIAIVLEERNCCTDNPPCISSLSD